MHKFVVYYLMLMSSFVGNTNHTLPNNFTFDAEAPNSSVSCELCKDIVTIVDYELTKSNETINDIEKIIGRVCSMLRLKSQREECYDIDNMIDEIKNMIIGGLDKKEICYKIGFCNK